MKFSIIIPTLNEENYIGGLLESLVSQTFKDFEVIVVDEGGCVLAVGRAVLSSSEMLAFKTGVAVKVRHGVKES